MVSLCQSEGRHGGLLPPWRTLLLTTLALGAFLALGAALLAGTLLGIVLAQLVRAGTPIDTGLCALGCVEGSDECRVPSNVSPDLFSDTAGTLDLTGTTTVAINSDTGSIETDLGTLWPAGPGVDSGSLKRLCALSIASHSASTFPAWMVRSRGLSKSPTVRRTRLFHEDGLHSIYL